MTRNIAAVKDMIIDYIKKPIPLGCNVVPRSIPVCFFGNIENARVATIGINPSNHEFTGKRFYTRDTLPGCPGDLLPLSQEQAELVYNSLLNYFDVDPYDEWFGKKGDSTSLCGFMKRMFGASFYDGSLVHLDITPWGTYPVWSTGLSDTAKEKLIDCYREQLKFILDNLDLELIYINGSKVKKVIEKALRISFKETPVKLPGAKITIIKYEATYNGKTKLVGTNSYFKYTRNKILQLFSMTDL